MIRFFLYALLALLLGAALPILLRDDPGYLLLSYGEYSVETTLVFTLLLLLALGFAAFWLVRAVIWLNPWRLLRGQGWLPGKSRQRARRDSDHGLILLGTGQWQSAYQLLLENAPRVDNPVINYLAAAYAAQQRGESRSREYCLEQAAAAAKSNQKLESLVQYWQAMLESERGDLRQSVEIFLTLHQQAPANPLFLDKLKDLYLRLGDWEQLAALLPALRKHQVLTDDELMSLQRQVALDVLAKCVDAAALKELWHDLPIPLVHDGAMQASYVRRLHQLGERGEALTMLLKNLRHEWRQQLVLLLGELDFDNPAELLTQAEQWRQQRDDDAALALSLARLSRRLDMSGKASEYLESALGHAQESELRRAIHLELAELLAEQGDPRASIPHYREVISLSQQDPK